MHSRFGRVHALFVIAMEDQPLLRDLKMQLSNLSSAFAEVVMSANESFHRLRSNGGY